MALREVFETQSADPFPHPGAEGHAVALSNVTRVFGVAPAIVRVDLTVSRGERLRLLVTDRGSGVDPGSMLARVDGRFRPIRYESTTGLVQVGLGRLAAGRHRLVFTVADYQETKNTEDASSTLPNTRRLTTTFIVR